jgi:hypothetical protein
MKQGLFLLLTVLTAADLAVACQCEASFGTCKEVRLSDLVFIGKVRSIQPLFLNRWYDSNKSAMTALNETFVRAEEHPSPDSLRQVKDAYLAMFPQLDDSQKRQVESAQTSSKLPCCWTARSIAGCACISP